MCVCVCVVVCVWGRFRDQQLTPDEGAMCVCVGVCGCVGVGGCVGGWGGVCGGVGGGEAPLLGLGPLCFEGFVMVL